MMNRSLLALIFALVGIFTPGKIFAQPSGITIVGAVIDSATTKPIEFATVTIKLPGDSSILTGALTDLEGKFSIAVATGAGSYILDVNFIGYTEKILRVDIPAGKPFHQVGRILIHQDAQLLEGVQVIADKSYFQGSIDKKVYNIEKDIIASNGSAAEALQTIPSVVIDIDGNISLRGNEGVRIFIDGKPSGIVGANMNAILEQIPASTIESIEVITNPSARYDAEGNSGIINIVLKKNKKVGLNGNISSGISTAPRYEAGGALNFRNQKYNFYSNYTYTHDERDNWGDVYRKTADPDTASYFTSSSFGTNYSQMHMARAGLDYYLNGKTTIGINGSFNSNIGNREDSYTYSFRNSDSVLTSTSERTTLANNSGSGYNAGINFRRTFSNPKHILTAEGFYAYGRNEDINAYEEHFFDSGQSEIGDPALQNVSRPGENTDISAQTDYVHPFKKSGQQLETGIKYTQEKRDNTLTSTSFNPATDAWVSDDSINNHFVYTEDVIAAYLIWNGTFSEKFGYQVGLRAEQTYTLAEQLTLEEDFVNNYFGLFPSAHIRYAFNEKAEISASYSRRIDRPNAWFLNPFPDYSDPYTFRLGNPELQPEYENSFEIAFEKDFKKHSISSSLYFNQTLNEISPYTVVTEEGISYMTFQNYNNEAQYGFEVVTRDEWFKWWNMTTTFNFNQTLLDAQNLEAGLTNAQFTYNIRIMQMLAVYKQTSLQLTTSYNTPWTFAQGVADPIFFMDLGVKSDFFQNKLSVNLNLSDIFDTRQMSGYSEGFNFYQDYTRKRQSRIALLKLTWKFGQQDNQRRRSRGMDEGYDGGMDMF